jgi:hypothetical protein
MRRFIAAFKITQKQPAEFSPNTQALFYTRLDLYSLLHSCLTNRLTSGSPANIQSAFLVWNMRATRLAQLIFFCEKTRNIFMYIYLFLTAIGLTPGGSSTLHFTHKLHTEYRERKIHNNKKKKIGKCGPCPVFASYTLAFALHWGKITDKPQLG